MYLLLQPCIKNCHLSETPNSSAPMYIFTQHQTTDELLVKERNYMLVSTCIKHR